ncbi:MAG: glycosyltransferase [Actinobacteria bacterium]|nr:MAG: glycosyltransferase [Actinomycetota bacterium]
MHSKDSDMARLTVVIPTFNRPGYLAECLQSVAEQTFRDFDLVVLDNASTEEYGPVLDRFSSLALTYIKNPENIGAARNIDKARTIGGSSEYHIVFHDDDLMHPRLLEWQIRVLDAHPEVAWVATECRPFESGTIPTYGAWPDVETELEVYATPDALVRRLLENVSLNFGSVMFRSERSGGVPVRAEEFEIVADRVLLCDIAKNAPVALIRRPLVHYRHHAGQDTHNPIFRERHALDLMTYYAALLPIPIDSPDRTLLTRHATNYLLHARAMVAPENRTRLSDLTRDARAKGLFAWPALDGQGVAALAHVGGVGGAFDAIRPILGKVKRRLSGE